MKIIYWNLWKYPSIEIYRKWFKNKYMREFEIVRETVVVGDLRRNESGNGNKIRETNIII